MSISTVALRNAAQEQPSEDYKTIFSDRELYILLERFYNQAANTHPATELFLQSYFNDEGYVDIWRIPHVMMDVLLRRTRFNRVFENREFRKTFHGFIRELMVFCSRECHRDARVAPAVATGFMQDNDLQSGRHEYLNALMSSFTNVLENLAREER